MNNDDGRPAFPVTGEDHREWGVSIRDYFAAKAIQGMMANDEMLARYAEIAEEHMVDADVLAATGAYKIADAMLKERTK